MSRKWVVKFFSGIMLYIQIAALGLGWSMFGLAERAHAALVSRSVLKSFFQTGDKPTQPQFAALIDSVLNIELDYGNTDAEHGMSFDNGRVAIDGSGQVRVFGFGEQIGGLDNFGGLSDNVVFNPLATAGTQDIATGGEFAMSDGLHYGFLQMRMDPAGSATPYAIHINYFVYEETPGVGITTFFQAVPEPSTCVLAIAGVFALIAQRRRR